MRYAVAVLFALIARPAFADEVSVPRARADASPSEAPSLLSIERDRIVLRGGPLFDGFELHPGSLAPLREVARFLQERLELRLQVAVHSAHPDRYGLKGTQRRAAAVRHLLVVLGVAASRIEALGYGHTRPIAPNRTAEGRAMNERVELWLSSSQDGGP